MELTQKEKAKELYDKIDEFIYTSNAHFADEEATKKAALLCVDEIIAACEYNQVEAYNTDWWNKVKEEIIIYDSTL